MYLWLLDVEADGADWTEVARILLHIALIREPERALSAWDRPHLHVVASCCREHIDPDLCDGLRPCDQIAL
jgi:hypothetical protein